MMRPAPFILIATAALGACSTPGGPYPSLAPRAGEAVDPRLPVERPINDRPVTPALAARLAELVNDAERGQAAFAPACRQGGATRGQRRRAAKRWLGRGAGNTVGGDRGAGPTARALGDVDAIGGDLLEAQRGLAPNDLAAIERAQAEVGALDQRQSDRIKAVQNRLGI